MKKKKTIIEKKKRATKMQAKTPPVPMIIDSATAIKLASTNNVYNSTMLKKRSLMACNDAWHRIKIIKGGKYDKETILRTILKVVEPADLIPVRYQVSGEDAYFMARNCGPALESLCRLNLIVKLPNDIPIVMVLTLAFASIHDLKINIQPILLTALTRRYKADEKYLSLDDFHRDPEIAKTVYCPLSQSKTLVHTLKLAKTTLGPFEYLSLRHNDLETIGSLENLNLTALRGLDLRHNNFLMMEDLEALKSLAITDIWLDGNPLCENYGNPKRYIDSVKLYCPNLRKLDGISIDEPELPRTRDNYYINESDAYNIVQQFLTHYYNIYDHKDRLYLSGVYHKNALYSLTFGNSSKNKNQRQILAAYAAENRNIRDSSNDGKIHDLIYRGPQEIVETLKRLPDTIHDRSSFYCDIMHEAYRRILVSVNGLFKTGMNSNYEPTILSFSRTFLLIGREENEYLIHNDQCHVDTALPVTTVFNEIDVPTLNESNETDVFGPREKERMIYTLMEVTTMNTEWCHRFLNDAKWNARRALQNFMDNYKSSNIPIEAFDK